jgi:hypothetical protein
MGGSYVRKVVKPTNCSKSDVKEMLTFLQVIAVDIYQSAKPDPNGPSPIFTIEGLIKKTREQIDYENPDLNTRVDDRDMKIIIGLLDCWFVSLMTKDRWRMR